MLASPEGRDINKRFIILRHCASKNCSFVYFHVQLKDYLSKGDGRGSEELVRAFSFFIEPTAIKRLVFPVSDYKIRDKINLLEMFL